MKTSVNYLMSGDAHAPYLLVSLVSLRNHYDGEITVWAYPESIDTVKRIAEDSSLGITPKLWEPYYRGKNGQFLNKIRMMRLLESERAIYLDADTMIRGDIVSAFNRKLDDGYDIVATQFCDWLSSVGTIALRVKRLLGREGIDQESVWYVLDNACPSVNGGVFACDTRSYLMGLWDQWSQYVKDIFICDETVLHAVMGNDWGSLDKRYLRFGVDKRYLKFGVLMGGAYNCSPKYKPKNLSEYDVKIWHFHGDSNVRINKSKFGVSLWYPEFDACIRANIGNVNDWIGGARMQNRFLNEFMKGERI